MALIAPLNDRRCLTKLHEEVRRYMRMPQVRAFAARFSSLAEFIDYVRHLEQRPDLGDPHDGPRLPCQISQRTRWAPDDPNCWERTFTYLAVAEILAPGITRTSASLCLDRGWHTFPVEFHRGLPQVIVLDPVAPPRNAMLSAVYGARNLVPGSHKVLPRWFDDMVRNACTEEDTVSRLDNALSAMRNALTTGEPIDHLEDREDLEYVLDLAAEDSHLWGDRGKAAYDEIRQSIRNLSFKLDTSLVSDFLDKVVVAGEKLAPEAIKAALIAEFGPAAAIALQGVDLGFAGDASAGAAESSQPGSTPDKASSKGKGKDKARAKVDLSKLTRGERIALLYRMTPAFR